MDAPMYGTNVFPDESIGAGSSSREDLPRLASAPVAEAAPVAVTLLDTVEKAAVPVQQATRQSTASDSHAATCDQGDQVPDGDICGVGKGTEALPQMRVASTSLTTHERDAILLGLCNGHFRSIFASARALQTVGQRRWLHCGFRLVWAELYARCAGNLTRNATTCKPRTQPFTPRLIFTGRLPGA
jgi:hypothetical protein